MARKKQKRGPTIPPAVARTALRSALYGAVLVLVGAAFTVAGRSAWSAVRGNPSFGVTPDAIALGETPHWVDGQAMDAQLRPLLADVDGASVFDRDLADRVAQALQRSPWVLFVRSVTRRLPESDRSAPLEVQVVFRRPAARVALNGRTYLVDRDGVYLPDTLFREPADWAEAGRQPVVVDRALHGSDMPHRPGGELRRRRPAAGTAAPRPGRVALGARLCERLRQGGVTRAVELSTVDVTGVGDPALDPEILLTTASGVEIRWGRSDLYAELKGLSPRAGSLTDREKIDKLLSNLERYPGFPGIEYIDMRYHGRIYWREAR
jgi:hypothetical protein